MSESNPPFPAPRVARSNSVSVGALRDQGTDNTERGSSAACGHLGVGSNPLFSQRSDAPFVSFSEMRATSPSFFPNLCILQGRPYSFVCFGGLEMQWKYLGRVLQEEWVGRGRGVLQK